MQYKIHYTYYISLYTDMVKLDNILIILLAAMFNAC